MGCGGGVGGIFGNNNCVWLVIILVIIFCFGGWGCGIAD
jgi:hypothetical protein